jgi:hypothetical protein
MDSLTLLKMKVFNDIESQLTNARNLFNRESGIDHRKNNYLAEQFFSMPPV